LPFPENDRTFPPESGAPDSAGDKVEVISMKTLWVLVLILMAGTSHAQIDITTGLVAHYPFNGDANDVSGNDNHGTVIGAVLATDASGRVDGAYEFNGQSSYISIPNSASLISPTSELTMIAWIQPYGWSKVGSAFGPILMKSATGNNSFQYRLAVSTSGVLASINDWNNSVTSGTEIVFNQWHAVAVTISNDNARLYYDGRLVATDQITPLANTDDRPLEIGRDVPGLVEYFFGKIDDIRIYNRALTDLEVRYASGFIFFDSFETP